MAMGWALALVLAVALIDRDPELEEHFHKLKVWQDYYHQWHDLPVFGPDGRWNVERDFDHAAHWKWQLEEIRRLYDREVLGVPGDACR
jgi:hypothetical protein